MESKIDTRQTTKSLPTSGNEIISDSQTSVNSLIYQQIRQKQNSS
jgi:hypothetical protein